MKKLDLTVVILTHINDERFEQALSSAQIAEKVIVVDNNSHNDWKKMEKSYYFELFSRENKIGNFAKVRNSYLEKVKTDWVLFLDSDESLGRTKTELKNNYNLIKELIESDLFDGVVINRKDVFLGKELGFGEVGNVKITRMFKVNKGKFEGNVHEKAVISGKIGESQIVVSHFSHENIADFFNSIVSYAKLASLNERSSFFVNAAKMVFYPIGKFLVNYFLRLGFLDGYRGFVYALMMSFHSFFVRVFYFEKYFQKHSYD